jgi:hypothetical protein
MKKAVEAQRQAVDDALSRLRAVAGQMGKALELGLIHSGRLNANVQTLIRALADPAKSNGDARAAIENYLKAATEAAHALMLGPAEGLSGRIHAVTLKPEDTPLAMMHAKLVSAVKGNPQANAILGRYINPASAAQAGRWVRRGKAGAQEAYENLPTELERYHRDLVDVIAVEEARLARAQRNPRAGSSIKSKRQVVMTQRGTALSGLLPLVGQAFSQVPAEYDGVIDQLIQKESAQGLPLVIVTPDSLGYRELSNLRSRFENGNVKLITLSTYQDFMKEKGQVTDQARSEAMQDLMPKLEEAQAAPSAPVADSLAETAAKASVKLMAPVIVLPTPEQKQRSLLARAAAVAGLGVIVVAYQSLVFHGVAPDFMTLFQPAQADPTQVASAGFASPVAFAGFLLLRYWGKVRAAGQDISLNARNLGRILTNA